MTDSREQPARPYLIGVAGPSCAGKTELSRGLAAQLPAIVLPLDCYYIDLADRPLEERARFNFDEPEALDQVLFLRHVRALSAGLAIERPVYDFATHTRTSKVEPVLPGKFHCRGGIVRPLLGGPALPAAHQGLRGSAG